MKAFIRCRLPAAGALILIMFPVVFPVLGERPAKIFVSTFQQGMDGYEGTRDTWLQIRHGREYWNAGGHDRLFTHGHPELRRESLLKFKDIFGSGGIPAGISADDVVSATLRLTVYHAAHQSSGDLRVYAFTTPWEAGSADNAAAADGDSTAGWRFYRHDGVYAPEDYWGDDGVYTEFPTMADAYGDVHWQDMLSRAGPFDYMAAGQFGEDGWPVDLDVTEAVRGWLNGKIKNHGFWLRSPGTWWQQYQMYSSGYEGKLEWRPRLTVEYRVEEADWLDQFDKLWDLSKAGDHKGFAALVGSLGSEVEEQARAAARGLVWLHQKGVYPGLLAGLPREEAVTLLEEVLFKVNDVTFQTASIDLLAEIGGEAAGQVLRAAVETGGWRVKRQAARALQEQGVETDKALVEEFLGWPMWRYDPLRSGVGPHHLAEDLHLQWVRRLPDPRRCWPHQWDDRGKLEFDVSYAPTAAGDLIFVPSNVTDSVTAYQLEDGRKVWRFYADGPVRLAPAVWEGKLYFGSDDGRLYCLDSDNGELLWKFRAGPNDLRLLGNERIISFWAVRTGPAVAEGTVYFAAGTWPLHGIFIYALDAETGAVQWVNDTTSSDYVPLPHGGAEGYGGLVPQGYLAVGEDQLVVAGGRTPPAFINRHTGVMRQALTRPVKGAGSYAVHAVDGGGSGYRRSPLLNNRLSRIREQIEGEVFYKLASRDRLIVSTEQGILYCFGPEETAPVMHRYNPLPLPSRTSRWSGISSRLLAELGEQAGYVLILGSGSGDLLRQLLRQSEMHIVVVDNDPDRVSALREELTAAGMYGRRAAVIAADPADFQVQPYLFSMIVTEDAQAAGFAQAPEVAARILNSLRPYGGLAWLGKTAFTAGQLDQALAAGGGDGFTVVNGDDHLAVRRPGPLPGAGSWTHQYHNAANTMLSQDERVRLPLGVLWFGGPNNHNILPRHGIGPRPQVAGGRQVFLGVETIAARCVYTGRELWEREFPGIGHPFTNLELEQRWAQGREVFMSCIPGVTYIGSPYVTLPDAVYVRYDGVIHRLDPATGKTIGKLNPPGRSTAEIYGDEEAPEWGHLSVQGDYLITTSEPHLFEDQELGRTASYSGTSSRRIAVFNRHTGNLLWQRQAAIGYRHGAIVSGADTLYVIDGLSRNALNHLQRRGMTAKAEARIMAVDIESGRELWSSDSDVFGTFLIYSSEHDILIEGGLHGMLIHGSWSMHEDEPAQKLTAARNGKNGAIIWRNISLHLPAAVRGEMLIPGRPGNTISILDGKTWSRRQPLTGTRSNWNYNRRYGCDTLSANRNLLFFRTGYGGYFDLEYDSGTGNFSGFRSGCTANLIPADGVVNALDYTRTCTCSYGHQTSLALVHMPDDPHLEAWTRYQGALPDPRGHGWNFGAPGRRVDVAGSGRVWHDRSGHHRRHPSVIRDRGESLEWVLASALEIEGTEDIRIDDVVEGKYRVRFHFAELNQEVGPGQRVFEVLINGEKVLNDIDIAAAADGSFRGLVKEAVVTSERRMVVTLRRSEGARFGPLINGIELVRK